MFSYCLRGGSEVIINRMREKIKAKVKNEKYKYAFSLNNLVILSHSDILYILAVKSPSGTSVLYEESLTRIVRLKSRLVRIGI